MRESRKSPASLLSNISFSYEKHTVDATVFKVGGKKGRFFDS